MTTLTYVLPDPCPGCGCPVTYPGRGPKRGRYCSPECRAHKAAETRPARRAAARPVEVAPLPPEVAALVRRRLERVAARPRYVDDGLPGTLDWIPTPDDLDHAAGADATDRLLSGVSGTESERGASWTRKAKARHAVDLAFLDDPETATTAEVRKRGARRDIAAAWEAQRAAAVSLGPDV